MCKNATDNKQGYCNLAHSQTSNFIQVGAVRGHNLASNANRIDFNKEIPVDLVVCLLCCHVGQALVLHNRCEHDVKKDRTIFGRWCLCLHLRVIRRDLRLIHTANGHGGKVPAEKESVVVIRPPVEAHGRIWLHVAIYG